jgi:hypothetical protein
MIEFYRGFGIGDVREPISDPQVREPQELFLDRVDSLDERFFADRCPQESPFSRSGSCS